MVNIRPLPHDRLAISMKPDRVVFFSAVGVCCACLIEQCTVFIFVGGSLYGDVEGERGEGIVGDGFCFSVRA